MMKADLPSGNPEGHSEESLLDLGVQYLDSLALQSAREQLVRSRALGVV